MAIVDPVGQELIEIDENLIRNDLHYGERGRLYKRRKEIYEVLYPESKKGQHGHKGSKTIKKPESEINSFTENTSTKANQSQRTIQQELQIAESLDDEVLDSVIKHDIPKTEALKLVVSRRDNESRHIGQKRVNLIHH